MPGQPAKPPGIPAAATPAPINPTAGLVNPAAGAVIPGVTPAVTTPGPGLPAGNPATPGPSTPGGNNALVGPAGLNNNPAVATPGPGAPGVGLAGPVNPVAVQAVTGTPVPSPSVAAAAVGTAALASPAVGAAATSGDLAAPGVLPALGPIIINPSGKATQPGCCSPTRGQQPSSCTLLCVRALKAAVLHGTMRPQRSSAAAVAAPQPQPVPNQHHRPPCLPACLPFLCVPCWSRPCLQPRQCGPRTHGLSASAFRTSQRARCSASQPQPGQTQSTTS